MSKRPHQVFAFILALAGFAFSGVYQSSVFTSGLTDRMTGSDSLVLAVRNVAMMKLYGDSILNDNHSRSQAPDVVASDSGIFCFFWAESSLVNRQKNTVYRREIKLREKDFVKRTPVMMRDTVDTAVSYLHGRKGKTVHFATLLNGSFAALLGCTDTRRATLYAGGISFSSQCSYVNDTFLIVQKIDNSYIVMRKMFANATPIPTVRRDTVGRSNTSGARNEALINPSVAIDSNGTRIALWTRKITINFVSENVLEYKLLSAAMVRLDSARIRSGVGESDSTLTYYDDAPVVSFARNKFAAVSWYRDTVFLHTFSWDGAAMATNSTVIATGTICRFPTIATNGRFLVVAWKGDLNGDTRTEIDGVRFSISSGLVSATPIDTFYLSDAARSLPTASAYSAPLNAAVDSTGAIGVAWPSDKNVWGCVWAPRSVIYTGGRYLSPVQSINVTVGDSVRLYPASLQINSSSLGTIFDSVQTGTSPDTMNSSAWGQWVPASDAARLNAAARGVYGYFRYRITMQRGTDSLQGPAVRKIVVPWDVQPAIAAIDSVRVGTIMDRTVAQNDTLICISRADSIRLFWRARDADNNDSLRIATRIVSSKDTAFRAAGTYAIRATFTPLPRSDTVYACVMSATDSAGWQAVPRTLFLRTENAIPAITVKAVWDSAQDHVIDTTIITGNTAFNVPQGDSIAFLYSVRDINDPATKAYIRVGGVLTDSVSPGSTRRFVRRSGPTTGSGFASIRFSASDHEDSTVYTVLLGVNHPPSVRYVKMQGSQITGDSIAPTIGAATAFSVSVLDEDSLFWDSVPTYRFTTARFDSTQTGAGFAFVPDRRDTSLRIIVTDFYGKRDTVKFWLQYPWMSLDPADNPGLSGAIDTLENHIALISGAGFSDTVDLVLRNTGNTPVSINSLRFTQGKRSWRSAGVPTASGIVWADTAQSFSTAAIRPDSSMILLVRLCADGVKGDGIVYDTLIMETSDPAHRYDALILRMEYNDLPAILDLTFDFAAHTPYWLAKRANAGGYRFPPHARIQLTFSEPMDTLSAQGAVACYSILDSVQAGHAVPITLDRTWSSDFTKLFLTPEYVQPSGYFSGLLPPAGMFIPTDSIALIITSGFRDLAQTPSGPNALDVNNDFHRDINVDTLFAVRVDSITFAIVSVLPADGSSGAPGDSPIVLTFNEPLFPGTITPQSLVLTSAYRHDPIPVDSVVVNGATASFYPSKRFFFGDTVYCRYRAVSGRDTLGYSIDASGDGIPANVFDSASGTEDRRWSFAVSNNLYRAVSPAPDSAGVPGRTPVAIIFTSAIVPGTMDTSRTGNHSMTVYSRLSRNIPFTYDSVRIRGSVAKFYLSHRLYYEDTVTCEFHGLVTSDTALFAIDPGANAVKATADSIRWRFTAKPISIASVAPAEHGLSSNLHAPITIRFSDRIYPGAIDLQNRWNNQSFRIVTKYSAGQPYPFRTMTIAADSMSVTWMPDSAFFSYDSIACHFLGFAKTFSYDAGASLPDAGSAVMTEYSWYFRTGDVGFYVFPNPYKPGKDFRHCGAADAPCGIWFKNLHALTTSGNTEVAISVMDIKGFPVYDTRSAGVVINFTENDSRNKPQWKWDTRNTRGELVASGLYLYAIYDKQKKTLMKGKLMIVR
jgi:hypothetical protein